MGKIVNFFSTLGMGLCALAGVAVLFLLPWWLLLALVVLFAAWIASTRRGRQVGSVTWVGLSTLPQRLGASSVVVVGIAGVVGVLVALLAMGEGFQATMKQTGSDDTAIVMRAGAMAELNSVLGRDDTMLVAQAPGVLHDKDGEPITSAELVVVASMPKKSSGLDANVEIRGVGPRVWAVEPGVRIVEGRTFQPGLRELIVGKGAREQFGGVDIGATLVLNNQQWTVVGAFDAGDAHDSELWGDADVVASTYRRGSSRTSVTVRLTGADAFDGFKAALTSDPRLKVDVKTTRAYYSEQSEGLARMIRILGTTIGAIMAIGAIFGALNTMYAAVATRAREIATLRAIGFRGLPVVVSVLLETMLLALAGGLLGAAIAWLVFNNYTVSTLGSNFSQVVFAFKVSPALVWSGLKWALAIGFVGGLFPALRAARLPVTTALRES
ncbi:MAG: ABC transporter permease [Rhodanobacteraceae bacterium]|jgi:putative ABC transport system permease protein|nr:ABC transporter permease [Rhodanobacteraceae bacterium]